MCTRISGCRCTLFLLLPLLLASVSASASASACACASQIGLATLCTSRSQYRRVSSTLIVTSSWIFYPSPLCVTHYLNLTNPCPRSSTTVLPLFSPPRTYIPDTVVNRPTNLLTGALAR
ncbi:hypothetical protein F4859DRAFT_495775 [Xylaria cf. heliscus]|nr:hypothetical protein F4859DRAFT_495775 [Xylaria cf. heliscus]